MANVLSLIFVSNNFRQKQMLNQFQKRFTEPKRELKVGKYLSYFAQTFRQNFHI